MGLIQDVRLWASRRRYQPRRESLAYPKILSLMGQNRALGTPKPTPTNLRYFSRTVWARRAINIIKGQICALEWEIAPDSKTKKTLTSEERAAIRCFERPNSMDSFHSLLEQFVEDALVTGAGVLEVGESGSSFRPFWLWPVDATTIRPVPKWDGDPNSYRFVQAQGYVGGSIFSEASALQLRAKDILYMRLNPSSETPYGFGPLEIAYNSIAAKLGVWRFAKEAASNAQPANLVYAGQTATEEQLQSFRVYWRNEVEGQGQTPIISGPIPPEVLKLHAGSDEALYLKWQEFLIREIATAFELSPANFGIERDVNRSTAEASEDRDWDTAIKPRAKLVEDTLSRTLLQDRFGLPLVFRFKGMDRDDEQARSAIYQTYYRSNVVTPNEERVRLGMEPTDNPWMNMTWAECQLAIKAAQGAKEILDPDLQDIETDPNARAPGAPKPGRPPDPEDPGKFI